MHSYFKVLALAILSAGVFSCAKETSVDSKVYEDRIIDAYVEQTGMDKDPNWKKTATGLYVNTTKEGAGEKPTATDWIQVKYVGTTLQNDYFQTTDTATFEYLGYNLNYFHIVPDFLFMSGNMPQGFREALYSMKEGGKVKLLIPSYLGFGAYGAIKFGQMPILPNAYVQANSPVKYELELVKVISKPLEYDSLLVQNYIKKNAGYTQIEKNNVFIKEIKKGSTAPDDTIGNGSTAYVHYAGFFLDNYCFDTNIDTVAKRFAPYNPYTDANDKADGDTLVVNMRANESDVVKGFDLALRNMTKGSIAEVVFTSSFGYGISGRQGGGGKPSIAPYSPLRFFIIIDSVANPKKTEKTAYINSRLKQKYLRKN